jgi:hypothetical protein
VYWKSKMFQSRWTRSPRCYRCRVLNLLVNGIEAMRSIARDDMILTASHLICHLRCVYL